MLKLLLAQTTRSASGRASRYFLGLADEVNADVTVLKPGQRANNLPVLPRLLEGFSFSPRFGRSGVREAVETSRLFSYDLILASQRNGRGLFWKSPTSYLIRAAWSPVMLVPEGVSFAPFHNILFTDNQVFYSGQPILRKLNDLWPHQRFLYPSKRKQHRIGSYHARRFDETGYNAVPELDINRLRQYVKRHRVGLVVTSGEKSRADNRTLAALPVPTLYFNSRNTSVCTHQSRPAAISASIRPL